YACSVLPYACKAPLYAYSGLLYACSSLLYRDSGVLYTFGGLLYPHSVPAHVYPAFTHTRNGPLHVCGALLHACCVLSYVCGTLLWGVYPGHDQAFIRLLKRAMIKSLTGVPSCRRKIRYKEIGWCAVISYLYDDNAKHIIISENSLIG